MQLSIPPGSHPLSRSASSVNLHRVQTLWSDPLGLQIHNSVLHLSGVPRHTRLSPGPTTEGGWAPNWGYSTTRSKASATSFCTISGPGESGAEGRGDGQEALGRAGPWTDPRPHEGGGHTKKNDYKSSETKIFVILAVVWWWFAEAFPNFTLASTFQKTVSPEGESLETVASSKRNS